MSDGQILRSADRLGQQWKNGHGQTFQIAAHPAESSLEDFGWRVSIALVEADGPFSTFAEVDRTIAVIDGAGMDLDIDDKVHQLGKFATYRFPGEVAVTAHLLRGPTRDLNLMVHRGKFTGRMEIFSTPGGSQLPLRCADREVLLVVTLDGSVRTADQDELGIEDVWQHTGAGTATVTLNGTAAVIHIRQL